MRNKIYACIVMSFLLLAGMALGAMDQSGAEGAQNLSLADFNALGLNSNAENAIANAGAPETIASSAGTELAAYTNQAPPVADQEKLMPSSITSSPPRYMYYNGDWLAWNDFSAIYPSSQPGLWVQRAVSWSTYATLPIGGWTQELLYVPNPSPLTMYEIYPGGYVVGYNLGFAQPGYYYIWFYADVPGRHKNVFATSIGYSNMVVIDVYSIQPHPTPPNPKKECEAKSYCHWVNSQCLCTMPPVDPKKECEAKPYCHWVNGQCLCTMPPIDPQKECESKPYCNWVNGQCLCTMPPVDPEKEKCESNPLCDYVDGHCYCKGFNPQPEPQPEPTPEPFNPAPNPVAQCEQNPSCHWANGQCLCTGLSPISTSTPEDSDNALGLGLGAAASDAMN